MSSMTDDDWITTREAAELSSYSEHHLRWLARKGRIDVRKFGQVWQVNRPALLRYMAGTKGDNRRGPKRKG